jgi:Bor protein
MTRADLLLALASLVLLALVSACYSTTVRSGKPVGHKAADADGRWHSGVLTGGVELSGPYDLDRLCPDGWAEIRTETSVFNEAAELLTFHLYAPQTVHVTCAAPPAGEPPDLL